MHDDMCFSSFETMYLICLHASYAEHVEIISIETILTLRSNYQPQRVEGKIGMHGGGSSQILYGDQSAGHVRV